MKGSFDNDKFYAALDAARAARGVTWKQVAGESRVSASTLTRMAQGKRPDVDGLAALLTWSGLSAESFLEANKDKDADPLVQLTLLVHGDHRLTPENKSMIEGVLRAVYGSVRK